MFTKKWLGIGLVLVLSLMLFAVPVKADLSGAGFLAAFTTVSGSIDLQTNGRIDLSPGYEGVRSFTVPVSGIYYQGLDWFDFGWYAISDGNPPDSLLELEVDGVLVEAVNDNTPVGGSLIAPVGSVVWAPSSVRRRGTVPPEMPLQAGVTHEMRVRVTGGHGAWLWVLYSDLTTALPEPVANAGADVVVAPSLLDLHSDSGEVRTANLSGSASSGTPPYTYSWSNGATTANTTVAVPFGSSTTYTLTVTDANGFKDSDDVQVTYSMQNVIEDLIDALPKGLLKQDTSR